MPSEKVLQSKKEVVSQLVDILNGAKSGVLVNYKGITVEADTVLRKELREANVNYFVVKNSLLERACKECGYEGITDVLFGTTAMAISTDDEVAPARILSKFAETSKTGFEIKKGFVDGVVMDAANITAIGKLPSKDILIAQVLGALNGTISGLARALNAIAEKQDEQSA